jgi:hypothetical protein
VVVAVAVVVAVVPVGLVPLVADAVATVAVLAVVVSPGRTPPNAAEASMPAISSATNPTPTAARRLTARADPLRSPLVARPMPRIDTTSC